MVAALVFANADAWAWYLGHILRAPLFSFSLDTDKGAFNIPYRFGPDLITCDLTHLPPPFEANLPAFGLLELVMKFSSV